MNVSDDGTVTIRGTAAVAVLLRLALAAKFQIELNAEHLLSPHVNCLIDELVLANPIVEPDWHDPAVAVPPSFREVVQVLRTYRDQHEEGRDLAELLRIALQPFDLPAERLDLGEDG